MAMKTTLTSILTIFAIFTAPSISAFSLNAEITGQQIRWTNSTIHIDGLTPSFWQPVSGLYPTKRWVPGGFVTPPANTITLVSGSDKVDIPITFVGFEFHIGSAGSNSASISGGCSGDFSVPIATVKGTACTAPYELINSSAITPFAFLRPIFNIRDADLLSALRNKPSGIYRGNSPLSNFYRFEFGDGGVLTKREMQHIVSFQIDYEAAQLTEVTFTGDGVIDPQYDLNGDRVWGSTMYDISARGYFINGLKVSLDAIRGDDYELIGPQLNKIPYSIICATNCSDGLFVDSGKPVNTSTIVSGTGNAIHFKVQTEFDHPHSPLEVGHYLDSFKLIFEPNL